jgi:hypothetical protein
MCRKSNAIFCEKSTYSRTLSSISEQLNTQNDLSSCLTTFVKAWQDISGSTLDNLFSGTPGSVQLLTNLIDNGAMLSPPPDSVAPFTQIVEKAFYELLIPQAWALSQWNLNPIIM